MIAWSETDLMIRDAVREFVDKEIRPNVDAIEDGEMEPYPIIRNLFASFGVGAMATEAFTQLIAKEEERAARRAAAEASGELPDAAPKKERSKSDGHGLGPVGGQVGMGMLAVAELSGVCMGMVASMGVSLGLTAATILQRGTIAQKKRWIPELLTFDKVGAWAITEPDAGSDAFGGMKTYVTRDGDDYILNGQKTFITNGPDADVIVVYAKLDEGDGADRRDRKVLTFVLEPGLEGFVQSRPFKKLGIHSSRTGQLFFDNVRLTRDRLLGETENHRGGDGRDSARGGFVLERVGVAAMSYGIINECLRLSTEYAKGRVLWGQEIAKFQLIQAKLVEMEIARMNVENMLFNSIEKLQHGVMPSLAEASAIKLYSSKVATDVAMEAIQLFGGNGYMREYRVEQLARDAKGLMLYAGSNEVQLVHVARGLLA